MQNHINEIFMRNEKFDGLKGKLNGHLKQLFAHSILSTLLKILERQHGKRKENNNTYGLRYRESS